MMAVESNSQKPFEIPVPIIRLVFEGEEYAGAEVRCRTDVSFGTFLSFGRIDENDPAQIEEAFRRFSADILLDWNLAVNGQPVPAHPDGLLNIPIGMANLILGAWGKAVASPLAQESVTNGDSSTPSVNAGAVRRLRSSINRRRSSSPS